jgi:hypothetical protein
LATISRTTRQEINHDTDAAERARSPNTNAAHASDRKYG